MDDELKSKVLIKLKENNIGVDNEQIEEVFKAEFNNINDYLIPYLEAWTRGEEPEFEFYGISSNFIMQKRLAKDYLSAITIMNKLINNPLLIHRYLDFWQKNDKE